MPRPTNLLESDYARAILIGLNRLRKPMYEGTVPPEEVARRRAANKQARAARKAGRR